MHFRNGREAKIGDQIIGRNYSGTPIAGVIVSQTSLGDTCNINVVPLRDGMTMTAKECLHIDDALPPSPPIPVS